MTITKTEILKKNIQSQFNNFMKKILIIIALFLSTQIYSQSTPVDKLPEPMEYGQKIYYTKEVVCGKQKKKLNVLVENNLKNNKNMKATLSYNLNDPDDRMAHLRAVKSLDMASALFEITRNLKKRIEHRFENTDNTNNDVFDGIQEVFDGIYEILGDNSIEIDELIN